MRSYITVAIIAFLIGVAATVRVIKPAQPLPVAKAEDVNKVIKKKVTKMPDGTVVTDTVTSIDRHTTLQPIAKPDNVMLTTNLHLTTGVLVQPLEHLWVGAEYSFQDKEIIYKAAYSTRIF